MMHGTTNIKKMPEIVNQMYTEGKITNKQTEARSDSMRTDETKTHPAWGLGTADTPQRWHKTTNSNHRQPAKPQANHIPQPESVLWNTREHNFPGRNFRARRNCSCRTNENTTAHIVPGFQGIFRQYITHSLIYTPANLGLQLAFPTTNPQSV